jgi:hypothetical protein
MHANSGHSKTHGDSGKAGSQRGDIPNGGAPAVVGGLSVKETTYALHFGNLYNFFCERKRHDDHR